MPGWRSGVPPAAGPPRLAPGAALRTVMRAPRAAHRVFPPTSPAPSAAGRVRSSVPGSCPSGPVARERSIPDPRVHRICSHPGAWRPREPPWSAPPAAGRPAVHTRVRSVLDRRPRGTHHSRRAGRGAPRRRRPDAVRLPANPGKSPCTTSCVFSLRGAAAAGSRIASSNGSTGRYQVTGPGVMPSAGSGAGRTARTQGHADQRLERLGWELIGDGIHGIRGPAQ